MDFTNKILLNMHDKRALYNPKFAKWYYSMFKENGGTITTKKDKRIKRDKDGNIVRNFVDKIIVGNRCVDEETFLNLNIAEDKIVSIYTDKKTGVKYYTYKLDVPDVHINTSVEYEDDPDNEIKIVSDSPAKTYYNRGERIENCMDLWLWDKYEINKILDLVKVNRCKNSRFCPNCKMLDVAKFIHKSRAIIEEYKNKGYKFYMLTLTIPSVEIDGDVLKATIEKLSKCFAKFFTKFGYEDAKAYKDRYFSIFGGIRVLEITCNKKNGFHPHLHCIVLLKDDPDEVYFEKTIKGKYSRKAGETKMLSLIELQIAKLWGMIWYGHRLTKKNIENYIVEPKEVYVKYYDEVIEDKVLQVDFKPLDEDGIFEVFKYTFKSSEIENYNIFKGLVIGLDRKRIRQGFGELFNVKVNDDELEDGELQSLELAVPEEPQQLLTKEILTLVNEYGDYKKISRFNPKTFNVDEYIKD